MSKLYEVAVKTVEEYSMLNKGDKVVVALSGGADSVALLNFLISIKEEYSLDIMAVHINHNLRGEEALRDENFVKELCQKSGVKLFIKSVDISTLAKEQKISTELCGRQERYKFFEELHFKYSCKIATAHTSSDNAETVIFNLSRGTGIKGITGIKPVRDYIIRPLIFVSRKQVENYCSENNLSYVTDSSNLTDDYTRNKIRRNVIPFLKEINPELEKTLNRTSKMFTEFYDYFNEEGDKIIAKAKTKNGYKADILASLPKALKTIVIYKIINTADVEYRHINLVCDALFGGAVNLPKGKRVVVKQNLLRVINDKDLKDNSDFEFSVKEKSKFSFCQKTYKIDLKNYSGELLFRTRKQGDKFTLPKRNVTKSVKKLFNEYKIPEETRDNLLLLTDGETVYWIENIGFSKQGEKIGIEVSVSS